MPSARRQSPKRAPTDRPRWPWRENRFKNFSASLPEPAAEVDPQKFVVGATRDLTEHGLLDRDVMRMDMLGRGVIPGGVIGHVPTIGLGCGILGSRKRDS